jgi:PD-(D/E)XK endonuclease
MEHPKAIGDRSTLAIMLALQAADIPFFLPFGENTRCDLVIDRDGRLARVQCKTGRLRDGAVRFRACSSYAHHANPKTPSRHYLGEVDYFAVYCRETGGVYLVPIGVAQLRREGALRIAPTRNAQRQKIRWANQFEVGCVRTTPGLDEKPGAAESSA